MPEREMIHRMREALNLLAAAVRERRPWDEALNAAHAEALRHAAHLLSPHRPPNAPLS